MKAVKANAKLEKENKQRPFSIQFGLFSFYKPACLQKYFHGRVLSIRVFFSDGHSESVFLRMNTIASRDQFKPIRIGENLVVNYRVTSLKVGENLEVNVFM